MFKTIHTYFNIDDLTELLNYLQQKGIPLLDNEQRQIHNLPSAVENITQISLYSKDKGCVFFSPCIYLGKQLQCGMFYLTQENSCPDSLKLFSQIKKAIRFNFSYSKENACYYGPGIYEDWLNKRICLPILFDGDRIELEPDKIESLLDTLKYSCFNVKANDVKLRDVDKVDLSVQSFIIYSDENYLIKTIIKNTWIHYEYDSACIFVYKHDKKGIYSLVLDRRIPNDFLKLRELFDRLKVNNIGDSPPA